MREIRIALYKWRKTFFSKLIHWKQKRKFPNKYAIYTHSELVFGELSFSSSEVDNGTRIKKILFKNENWDFITIKLEQEEYKDVLGFCMERIWKPYNWYWIFFAQILNFNLKGNDTWFCSEICTEALQQASILCGVSAVFVEPAELCYRLLEEWYKITK